MTEIRVTQSMTILGTADSSDTSFDGCFYLNNEGRNDELNIYIYGVATLTVGSAGHTTKLDIGNGVRVTLIQIENSHAKVEVSEGSCVNVFGGLDVRSDDWNYDEYFIGNICRFPDVMDFGERLLECVEAYELPAMTDDELADNLDRANEWPDGDGRIDGFKLLVKHGNLLPHTETDDQGNDYIVWRPYEKISYGVAIGVLTNVYKAIVKDATELPASVALGDEHWTPNQNDLVNDHDLEELLNKFVDVLPKVEDSTTEGFTIVRGGDDSINTDGMTITGKTFTKHITITCDPQYLDGDDFGGELKFMNCEFAAGVTVKMTGGIGYNLRLNNSCTGSFTVTAEDGVIGRERTGVSFFGMNGVTINGLHISGEVMDEVWDGDFNVNVRYDREGENGYIPTLEIVNITKGTVALTGDYTGKLRTAGWLDVSGVTLGENSRIELSNQCDCNMVLGSNDIFVNSDCGCCYSFTGTGKVTVCNQNQWADITVNGIHLGTPHIFGEHGEAIFFPLEDTAIGENTLTVKGKAVTFIVEQGNQTLKYAFDIKQGGSGVHLNPVNGEPWITDPNNVRVTVTVDGCTVVYDTIMWKPIQIGEFVDELNYALGTKYAFHDDIDESWEENDYLTYGMMKKVINFVKANYAGAENIQIESIINDDNYWIELDRWQSDPNCNENDNPDYWTLTWHNVKNLIRNLREELDMNSVEVTNVVALLNALAEGYTEIQVTENILLQQGENDDDNFDGSVYLNRADGIDQQRIYVQPDVMLIVGDDSHRIKLDIGDGVSIILCVDTENAEKHGVLQVNSGSCVNVFGALETPENFDEDYDKYVEKAEDANVSYMKRIAEFGGRLYDRLREVGKVNALTDAQLTARAEEDSWPEDDWNRQGMAFLEEYAGLTKKSEGDRTYWPSWDYASYGQVMELLRNVYCTLTNKENADLPGSVMLEDSQNNRILDDDGVDTLIYLFVDSIS